MLISGIQGQPLEVTVIQCIELKDTENLSKQDPYVSIEYNENKKRTRTCKDGGKNPVFHDKLVFTLIEGREEIQADVWYSNTFSSDDHIGSARIPLSKVLREGYDDSLWPLECKNGRFVGEIKLIMHCRNAKKHATNQMMSALSYPPPSAPPQLQSCTTACPPVPVCPYHTPMQTYYPPPAPMTCYPPAAYAPQPPPAYYPPPYLATTYPPTAYPQAPYPGQWPGAHPPY